MQTNWMPADDKCQTAIDTVYTAPTPDELRSRYRRAKTVIAKHDTELGYWMGRLREVRSERAAQLATRAASQNGGASARVAYTRDAAVARLAELGLDEEYADIECLSRAEHYEWLCTADADEIVSHREQMLRDAEGGAA